MSNLMTSSHDSPAPRRPAVGSNHMAPLRSQAGHGSGNNLTAYLNVIRRRKWTTVIPLFIVVPLVVWGILLQKPLYEAKATLLIEEVSPKIIPVEGVVIRDLSQPTEVEIIKDRVILEKVVDLLRYDGSVREVPPAQKIIKAVKKFIVSKFESVRKGHSSNFNTSSQSDQSHMIREQRIEDLQESLKVRPKKDTKLIDVIISGYDPIFISKQLNTLIDVYIKKNLDDKLLETRKAISWLKQESEKVKKKLISSELALQEFREKTKIVDFNLEKTSYIMQAFNDLNSTYISLKRDRILLESRVYELKKLLLRIDTIDNISIDKNNLLIKDQVNKYVDLKMQYEGHLKKYTENHPSIIDIKTRIEEVKVNISNILKSEINTLMVNYRILKENESKISSELDAEKERILKYKNDEIKYSSLNREFEVNKSVYLDILRRLRESSLTEALETNNIKIIKRASVPIIPVSSENKIKVLASILVGLGIGLVFAFIAEYTDNGFKNSEHVESYLGIPFLGVVPRHKLNKRRRHQPVFLQRAESPESERYRIIRTRIQSWPVEPVKTLLVTSAISGEGKSTTVANLGLSFAQSGQTVLIVDADLRRPTLHRCFGLTRAPGLSEVVVRGVDWRQVAQDTTLPNLKVLSAGALCRNPSELLHERHMRSFLHDFRQAFDMVIVDSPVVLSIPDVELLAPQMDGVLLVHGPEKGNREVAWEATKILERVGAPVLGMIFNDTKKQKYYEPHGAYESSHEVSPVVWDGRIQAEVIEMQPVWHPSRVDDKRSKPFDIP